MRSLTIKALFGGAGAALVAVAIFSTVSSAQDKADGAGVPLKPATAFDAIANKGERSLALIEEAGKVILHPRCVNCHPAGDHPLQGMAMQVHQPPVSRGIGDMGMPGMMCGTCHGPANVDVIGQAETIKSIPGHPTWHLAPIEMAWEGKSLGAICEQIKDPARNGGKTLDEIVEHMAHDSLVGWGWAPGKGREPVPGTQEEFGALIEYWVETGAACPAS